MDQVARAFYELQVELVFRKKTGDEFQDLFASLMELRFPGDYIRTRPWGNRGDKKNDGYRRSVRTLYQIYAPDDLAWKDAIQKIDEDFNGALPFWKDHFSTWTFVHNSVKGLGPDVLKKLLDLGQNNTQITLTHSGFPEFRNEVFQLSNPDIQKLLGPAPTQLDLLHVGFPKLKTVLLAVAKAAPTGQPDIKPVPPEKLQFNQLSSAVETLLRAGMAKSESVASFFSKWHEPTLGDDIAEAFTQQYRKLRESQLSPDQIFMELQIFAGGSVRGDPEHEAAVLAVLAHFFEECDIFEAPATEAVQ